jgi:hypothetical protein
MLGGSHSRQQYLASEIELAYGRLGLDASKPIGDARCRDGALRGSFSQKEISPPATSSMR